MIKYETLPSREAWLEKRKDSIGGSEAACIVGMNPYMNNVELWEYKTGRKQPEDISDKPYVKYGTEAEQYLRALFALDYPGLTVCYEPDNYWTNSDFPFAHASLDGWLIDRIGRKGILEIKTANVGQGTLAKWKDRVPDNYFIQILHYLMITGFDFAVIKSQLKSDYGDAVRLDTRHYWIERDEVEEDIEMLMMEEKKFWEYVKTDTRPALILPEI